MKGEVGRGNKEGGVALSGRRGRPPSSPPSGPSSCSSSRPPCLFLLISAQVSQRKGSHLLGYEEGGRGIKGRELPSQGGEGGLSSVSGQQ